MVSPAVSIIINCLNGEKYLREAIDSVVGQTFQDWEVIVWDNASTDNTAAIAESYGGRVRGSRGAGRWRQSGIGTNVDSKLSM